MDKHNETNAPGQLNGVVRPEMDTKYVNRERAICCRRGCRNLIQTVRYRLIFFSILQHIGKSYLLCDAHAAEYDRDKA